MRLLVTVLLGVTGLAVVSGRPQSHYFVPPDYIEAVESLPLATEPPIGAMGSISQRRQMEKQTMLKGIRDYILKSLAMPCRPRAQRLSIAERRKLERLVNSMQNQRGGHDGLLKRAQSFYPDCDHPIEAERNTDSSTPSLDVYFNLTSFFPSVPDDATIEQATLRVFKIAGTGGDEQTLRISLHAYPSGNDSSEAQDLPWDADDDVTPWSSDVNPWSSEEVTPWSDDVTPWSDDVAPWAAASTHWSAAPVAAAVTSGAPSAEPGQPRLVASLTVAASKHGWLAFDVRSAVRGWRPDASGWGFMVTIQDPSGRHLAPRDFLQGMKCDAPVTSSPVPGPLVKVAQDAHLEMQTEPRYPVLDLLTTEPAVDSVMPIGSTAPLDEPCPIPADGSGPMPGVRRRHRHSRHRRTAGRPSRHRRQR